jgi:hypothetical protein
MPVDGGDISSKRQRTHPPFSSTSTSPSREWATPAAAAEVAAAAAVGLGVPAQAAAAMSLGEDLVQLTPVDLLARCQQEQGMAVGATPVAAGGQLLQLGQHSPGEALADWGSREAVVEAAGGDVGAHVPPPPPPAAAAAAEGSAAAGSAAAAQDLQSGVSPTVLELLMVAPALAGAQAVTEAGPGPGEMSAAASTVDAGDTPSPAAGEAGSHPEWAPGQQQRSAGLVLLLLRAH